MLTRRQTTLLFATSAWGLFDRESLGASGSVLQAITGQAMRADVQLPANLAHSIAMNTLQSRLELSRAIDEALSKLQNPEAMVLAENLGAILSQLNQRVIGKKQDTPLMAVKLTKQLRSAYKVKFNGAQVASASHQTELSNAASIISSPTRISLYQAAETRTSVPWYIVAALHFREASLNPLGHLHNGDPLRKKTVQVPKGRPPGMWPPTPWDPHGAWLLSAQDALQKYKNVARWDVENTLFIMEGYNGWGFRAHHVNTPYLWNYTQYYASGGYPRDHVWSDSYRSRQSGLVPLIKEVAALNPSTVQLTFSS